MTDKAKQLEEQIRSSAPLLDRLVFCRERIGAMRKERRPPRMTIPVQWNDDDIFISTTIKDAMVEIEQIRAAVAERDAAIEQAVQAEREACAAECRAISSKDAVWRHEVRAGAEMCESAIMARNETKEQA